MKKLALTVLLTPAFAFGQAFPTPTFGSLTLQNPLTGASGGTGIANSSTITLGGNLTTAGANPLTLTTTGSTNITLPTSGTLLNGSSGATAGANSNITSLTGLTTPLSVPQGGTGTTTSTGSGSAVLSTSPSLTTPSLGIPSSVTLTNGTGLPVSTGVSGLGTGVATALGNGVTGSGNVVLATSPALVTPALGTPSSASLTNATGLPVSTGISGLGTGVATGLGNAVTGSGGPVLATSPTIATPTITSPTISNLTATGSVTLPANSVTNSELAQAAANTVECNTSTSAATIAHCVGFQLADPATGPFTGSTIYDSSRTAINGYPIGAEFGVNTLGVVQALVGAIDIPSTATITGNGTGVAGYARTANTATEAVGVYGQGALNPGGLQAWGGNFLVNNCPTQICGSTQGMSSDVYAIEADLNINTTSSGASPAGNARGLYVNGAMYTTMPVLNGVEIDHAGTSPWNNGIQFDTGCCGVAIQINPVATGNSQRSQAINILSTSSGGATLQSSIVEDSGGNLALSPGSGGEIALQNSSLTNLLTIGPSNVTASAPLLATKAAKVFATNTTGQSIPNNAATTVTGWSTSYDANSNFNASTGTFTAPVAGDYYVSGQLVVTGTSTVNDVFDALVVANGTTWSVANAPVASASVTQNTVQFGSYVHIGTAGQTIVIKALQNSGSAQTLSTSTAMVYLSIVQVP
ncbi:hypothetical protein R69608_05148 [Paraburkholderia nemoris]|uniref:beta strand repeat-containing protein n=1 Tax=Paraburkholderia nemoris TaxID=2793076 RepID=UPI0019143E9A|nr:hypothetical protein [Paraburkholderia nemoris]MBK5149650.1 hypothetical protein [Burkholderia sp. R-69608]CAE6939317.1 hypothetical protein R69608_05148 [Paraburkholderia nemoris]